MKMRKEKLNRILMAGVVAFGVLTLSTANVHADETGVMRINEGEAMRINEEDLRIKVEKEGSTGAGAFEVEEQLPSPTIQDANEWAKRKGADVNIVGQNIVKGIAGVAFLVGLAVTAFGALTRKVGQGLVIMALAAIVYTAAMYAPQILSYTSAWFGS